MTLAYHTQGSSGVSLSMSPSLNKSVKLWTRNPNPTISTSKPWNTRYPSSDLILENNLAVLHDGGVADDALYEYIGGGLALFFIVLCVFIFILLRRRAGSYRVRVIYSTGARSENRVHQEHGRLKMVTRDQRMQSGADLSRDARNRVRREHGDLDLEIQTPVDYLLQGIRYIGEIM